MKKQQSVRKPLDRVRVYQIINGERAYQDSLGSDRTDGSEKSVGDYLTMLRHYLGKADEAWTMNAGTLPALDVVRKLAAICVRCMEEHGAPSRSNKDFPPEKQLSAEPPERPKPTRRLPGLKLPGKRNIVGIKPEETES